MNSLKEILEAKVKEINQNSAKKRQINKWINGYRGKVICFQVNKEAYHLVFEQGSVMLRHGNYSSCEFSYIGPQDAIVNIIEGKDSAMSAGLKGVIKGWGSVNEAIEFEKLLRE